MSAARPKTLRQVKAEWKKRSSYVSDAERKRLERGAELDRRAEAIRERDRRRKVAQERREQHEEREREARRKTGVGLATQLAGFNHTQKRMKGAMENFLSVKNSRSATGRLHEIVQETKEDSRAAPRAAAPRAAADAPLSQLDCYDLNQGIDDELLLAETLHGVKDMHASGIGDAGLSGEPSPRVIQDWTSLEKAPRNKFHQTGAQTPEITAVEETAAGQMDVSPLDIMEQFLLGGTALTQELKEADILPRAEHAAKLVDGMPAPEPSEDDFGLSDFYTSPLVEKDVNLKVIVRDFAYSGSRLPEDPSRTHGHAFGDDPISLCRDRTSSGVARSQFAAFGLSTQALHEAFDDEEEALCEESSPTMRLPHRSRTLMGPPPPKAKTTTHVLKPPELRREGAVDMQDLGLSTQILIEAIDDHLDLTAHSSTSGLSPGDSDLDDLPWTQMGA